MKVVFLAVLLLVIVLSTEAKRTRKLREWRPIASRKPGKRPPTNLRRKIFIAEGKRVLPKGNFRKIVDLPPEKAEVSKSEHYVSCVL